MRAAQLIQDAMLRADMCGVPVSALKLLMSGLLDCSVPQLSLPDTAEPSAAQIELWRQSLERLMNHEPAQYILGKAWFYGLCFRVDPAVLIPRPETEGLVETALPMLFPGCRVLDIGTGSGAIAITIAKHYPQACVHATDISAAALAIAGQNASCHGTEVTFHHCDLFPQGDFRWDLIISNPPYISESDHAALEAMVRDHEPSQALLAGADGLVFYRRILAQAKECLAPGGRIAFEHGDGQRHSIIAIAREAGFSLESARDDLANRQRYLVFSHAGSSAAHT